MNVCNNEYNVDAYTDVCSAQFVDLRNFEIALCILEIAKMLAIFEIACAISRLRIALAQSRDRALALTAGALEASS